MTSLPERLKQELFAAAQEVCEKAYAPYSRHHVGAAVLTTSGHIYTGCNVENVSYGLTVCAERHAIARAVAEEGPGVRLQAIAVINREERPCTPCGACRQVIAEFGEKATVFYQGEEGWSAVPLYSFLPGLFEFAPEALETVEACA